jgi:hypothetical protein
MSMQLREILYTDSQDMLLLSSAVATTTAVQMAGMTVMFLVKNSLAKKEV